MAQDAEAGDLSVDETMILHMSPISFFNVELIRPIGKIVCIFAGESLVASLRVQEAARWADNVKRISMMAIAALMIIPDPAQFYLRIPVATS